MSNQRSIQAMNQLKVQRENALDMYKKTSEIAQSVIRLIDKIEEDLEADLEDIYDSLQDIVHTQENMIKDLDTQIDKYE